MHYLATRSRAPSPCADQAVPAVLGRQERAQCGPPWRIEPRNDDASVEVVLGSSILALEQELKLWGEEWHSGHGAQDSVVPGAPDRLVAPVPPARRITCTHADVEDPRPSVGASAPRCPVIEIEDVASRRTSGDRGSVTVWALGMVLVVMFIGAISFDLWSGFSTRRQLASAADQAAQAGANALDEELFRASGQRRLDPGLAEALAQQHLAAQGLQNVTGVAVVATADQVVVELTANVDVGLVRIFGDGDPLVVHVRATGQPREPSP